ncbi:hypothetical protein PDJAM_G00150500 [Pangasius djambal]|uniref:Uncharacterized protein n=1 Tax=Pangasius djambal TaxID=1691987 RepID=A0ACC5ZGL9_9TELE|nr:hypothetical protein [Pangasius djambal]
MPSYGYWAAVSISKGLSLGRGSACVFTDSPSDPPAQCSPRQRRRRSRIGRLTLDGLRFFPCSGGKPQLFHDTMNPSFGIRGRKE